MLNNTRLLSTGLGILSLVCIFPHPAPAAMFSSGIVSASADNASSSVPFTTLPAVTPATALGTNATSVTTPDATGTVFKGTFSQSVSSTAVSANGLFETFFVAQPGDTYSLFGSEATTAGIGSISVFLADDSKEAEIYSFQGQSTDSTATADDTGGPMTGSLVAGDSYQFTLSMSLSAGNLQTFVAGLRDDAAITTLASLTGSGGITIIPSLVPEPSTTLMLTAAAAAAFVCRRRRPSGV